MPVQEETGSVVVKTWSLDDIVVVREFRDAMFLLGFDSTERRFTGPGPTSGIQVQIDIPDKPRDPIIIDSYGTQVRSITMDGTLISLDKIA